MSEVNDAPDEPPFGSETDVGGADQTFDGKPLRPWTPDQPLPHDATDDQLTARAGHYILICRDTHMDHQLMDAGACGWLAVAHELADAELIHAEELDGDDRERWFIEKCNERGYVKKRLPTGPAEREAQWADPASPYQRLMEVLGRHMPFRGVGELIEIADEIVLVINGEL